MTPTQGNDNRLNEEKPDTTYQTCTDGILTVHLTDEPDSPIYFSGPTEDYKFGAVKEGLAN